MGEQYCHTNTQKCDKQKVENYRGISLFNACYKIYSQTVNENLKVQRKMFSLNARMDSGKADLASIHCLLQNYL